MKIVILGAGAWGTALAINASQGGSGPHSVTLWARDPSQAKAMQARRENARYLAGIALPPSLTVRADSAHSLAALVADADLVIIATPMVGLRGMLEYIRHCKAPVAWLCKGFEPGRNVAKIDADFEAVTEARIEANGDGDGNGIGIGIGIGIGNSTVNPAAFGLLAHEIQAQVAPELIAGVLSGPSFAMEVARGQPTALVASSGHAVVRNALVEAFHSPTLRVYANDDIVGVEVGGAVKNVLAIATGLCDGLNLGLNARAALITRGLAEMTRLGLALGAKAKTFMGLSGLGDLVLTATGDLSRNRKIGLLLAQGKTLQQALDSLGHVAEGVYCARAVVQRATGLGVEMPISSAVVALLDGQVSAAQAVPALMGREAREEA